MMGPKIIDDYHYCYDKENKRKKYNKDEYTNEELLKTYKIRKDILDFIRIVFEDNNYHNVLLESKNINEYVIDDTYHGIHYLDNLGYIAKGNYDRDHVDVYFYGTTHEEAFKNAICEFVMNRSHYFELINRERLNHDFSNRFKDGTVKEDDYYGPFFFAEHSLQLLRNYYGEEIPKDILNSFEDYVNEVENMNVYYSYETNRFERKEEIKKLEKKRGEKSDQKKVR